MSGLENRRPVRALDSNHVRAHKAAAHNVSDRLRFHATKLIGA
jgi:hypothetical protein